jgi:selenocysteine lyase/cysteine desulfurase
MIYFDNGATTFPKPDSVIYAVEKFIREIGGNPSRSSHKLSRVAGEEVYKAREAVCKLLHFDTPENIVFTYNATYAINMAIKSMIREKCHIICSDMEHNSVARPINALRERLGVEYSIFDSNI